MSSTYGILCLSHDPAITAQYGLRRPENAESAIQAGIEEHESCDLLIARYSGSLTEVGCPSSFRADRQRGQYGCCHSSTQWVDVEWLRLLAIVQQEAASDRLRKAAKAARGCWSAERLCRLGPELGVSLLPATVEVGRPSDAADQPTAAEPQPGLCPSRFKSSGRVHRCALDRDHKPMHLDGTGEWTWLTDALGAYTEQPETTAGGAG